jgi:hypothetical protein
MRVLSGVLVRTAVARVAHTRIRGVRYRALYVLKVAFAKWPAQIRQWCGSLAHLEHLRMALASPTAPNVVHVRKAFIAWE